MIFRIRFVGAEGHAGPFARHRSERDTTMQDEQFSRQWNAGHDRFSADLDRGLGEAQLISGAREILMPAGGLEGANRGEGRQAVHFQSYKPSL